jgi:hypothetical protein
MCIDSLLYYKISYMFASYVRGDASMNSSVGRQKKLLLGLSIPNKDDMTPLDLLWSLG